MSDYKLEDFLTATLAEQPAKMPLLHGKKDTGHHFMVLGSNSPKLKRAVVRYRSDYDKLLKSVESIEDEVEKEYKLACETEIIDIALAKEMIVETSFDDKEAAHKILSENNGLANVVIAFSFNNEQYSAKK